MESTVVGLMNDAEFSRRRIEVLEGVIIRIHGREKGTSMLREEWEMRYGVGPIGGVGNTAMGGESFGSGNKIAGSNQARYGNSDGNVSRSCFVSVWFVSVHGGE